MAQRVVVNMSMLSATEWLGRSAVIRTSVGSDRWSATALSDKLSRMRIVDGDTEGSENADERGG